MSADADQGGNLPARGRAKQRHISQGGHQRGTPAVSVRKPVKKDYGAKAGYALTKYEKERLARKGIGV